MKLYFGSSNNDYHNDMDRLNRIYVAIDNKEMLWTYYHKPFLQRGERGRKLWKYKEVEDKPLKTAKLSAFTNGED